MLQQTRVAAVVPYYERFLREFPTVSSLAEAPVDRVLALWSGLGYYRRARMLHAAAKRVVLEYDAALPENPDALARLEGVGAYTAGAVASIAFGLRAAAVDGNVTRVIARLFAIRDDVKTARAKAGIWELARRLVPEGEGHPGDWNQALMDLGATVCLPGEPKCAACPVAMDCRARALGIARQLPRATPKRAPTLVYRVALVLASASGVLLARRRPDVLFGGLWEPPSHQGEVGVLATRLRVQVAALVPMGEVVHVLSHRRLVVNVVRGELPRRKRWRLPGPEYDAIEVVPARRLGRSIGADGYAQAALTRKILSVANLAGSGLRFG
jgi:A/G-specific adenine glycosylase